jgi:hypothetical protein
MWQLYRTISQPPYSQDSPYNSRPDQTTDCYNLADEDRGCIFTKSSRTASSPKSVLSTWLKLHGRQLPIGNAITQTVQHCSIPGAGISAGPHRYNYARLLCCSAVVSFVLCALHPLRHHPNFQVSISATTQVLTLHTTRWWCTGMQQRSACRNLLDFTINSRGALQLLLVCVHTRAPTLADITRGLLNLLTMTAVIGLCFP